MKVWTIPVGAFETNCYIVFDEETKNGVIIDPGDESQLLLTPIEREGIHIKAIFLTHGHCDHMGSAKDLQDTLKVPLWAHKDDLTLIENAPIQAKAIGLKCDKVPTVTNFFEEGVAVSVDPLTFRVLHTPGHTPGGVVLVTQDSAFCGDSIFSGSIGRTDLPGGSYQSLVDSIRKKIYTLAENVILYTGHGPATTVGEEKRSNPFVRAFGSYD